MRIYQFFTMVRIALARSQVARRSPKTYHSASTHLAREHDYDTRRRFWRKIESQNLGADDYIFLCPICHNNIKGTRNMDIRFHCRKHDHQELLQVSEALVKAWNFSFGPITRGSGLFTITGDMILPYIILPGK